MPLALSGPFATSGMGVFASAAKYSDPTEVPPRVCTSCGAINEEPGVPGAAHRHIMHGLQSPTIDVYTCKGKSRRLPIRSMVTSRFSSSSWSFPPPPGPGLTTFGIAVQLSPCSSPWVFKFVAGITELLLALMSLPKLADLELLSVSLSFWRGGRRPLAVSPKLL